MSLGTWLNHSPVKNMHSVGVGSISSVICNKVVKVDNISDTGLTYNYSFTTCTESYYTSIGARKVIVLARHNDRYTIDGMGTNRGSQSINCISIAVPCNNEVFGLRDNRKDWKQVILVVWYQLLRNYMYAMFWDSKSAREVTLMTLRRNAIRDQGRR